MGSTLQTGGLKLGGGVINHESSDASSIVLCGGSSSSSTGANITIGGSSGSADRSVIFKANASETVRIDSAGTVKFSSSNDAGYIPGAVPNSFNSGYGQDNDTHATWLNFYGYNGGDTKYRDLKIGDGRTNTLVTVTGSTGLATFSNGIAFTQTGTAATGAASTSSTLDHYEEGTWTPNPDVEGAGDATATATCDGRYTRIGNRVFIEARLVLDAISGTSSSNAMEIKDLPFAANASNPGFLLKVNCSGLATAPGVVMVAHSVSGYLRIADDTGNGTQNASDHFQVGSVIWISGSYTV